jgi:hypothetical protein
LTQTVTCWEGSFTPKSEETYQIMVINEERDVIDWSLHGLDILRQKEYLRTYYIVGKSSEIGKRFHFLDVITAKTSDEIKLTAYLNGVITAKTNLLIKNPKDREKIKCTNNPSKVVFKPNMKGLYMIEVENLDKTEGNFK